MNFKLGELERHVDEPSLLQGEEWYEIGAVSGLRELERGLWVAEVAGAGKYEVEVKISPSKVTAASCECPSFHQQKMCGHVVALLLALRARRVQDNREKSSKKTRSAASAHTKITLEDLLENVPAKALRDFVLQYARQNRSFGLALQTRFTPRLEHPDGKEKYRQVLDAAIGTVRKTDRSITLRGSQRLGKVLDELELQGEGALTEEHFAEALDIAEIILEKITPILRKVTGGEELLKESLEWSLALIRQVAAAPAAPSLKERIWLFCLEESRKMIYRNQKMDLSFFRILFQLANDPTRITQLLERIEEQLRHYLGEDHLSAPLQLLKFRLMERITPGAEVRHLLEVFSDSPEVILYALEHAIGQKQYARARSLAESGLKMPWPFNERLELKKKLLLIAREEQDDTATERLSLDLFVNTLDLSYFHIWKSIHSKDYLEQSAGLIAQLEQAPGGYQTRRTIAMVLAETGQFERLFGYLREQRSLELLRQFDHHWIPDINGQLFQLYYELLSFYLKNHVGRTPSRNIRSTIEHLRARGASQLAESLVEVLRADYPERHSLMEELEPFL